MTSSFSIPLILALIFLVACQPVTRITTGEDAYRYKRYPEAISMLESEIEKSNSEADQAKKSFWIGESYRLMSQDELAIQWYRKAYELEKNQISLESYAMSVFKAQQYSNAKKLFQKLVKDYGTQEQWNNVIESCDAALVWIKEQDPNKYVIKKVKHNSLAADYSPTFYEDIMIFTSDRQESKGDVYHWTGKQFSDFYRTKENTRLDDLLYKINGPFNESSITFNRSLDHVVYTQCGSNKDDDAYEHCRLIEGRWDENDRNWISFRKLPFCQSDIDYGHPTFFNGDRGIIFSSNDENGVGGHDLWISMKKDDSWSQPVLMPEGINTKGDEKFPVMHGDTLYYSSNGKIGMGGLDIYFTKWIAPDGWTTPINLKPPINSGGDDFGIAFEPGFKANSSTVNRFFISSNRKGSNQDDIYMFEEKQLNTPKDTTNKEPRYNIVIEGKVVEHIFETPGDPNSRKMGTRPLKGAVVALTENDLLPEKTVDNNGEFQYSIESEGEYRFVANKSGYLRNAQYVNVELTEKEKRTGTKTYLVHIVLEPIVYDTEIILTDIFYDFDKWNIRPDAEPSLDKLVELLVNNPEIKIELASHTDCQGLEIYNAELSQRRAQSAVAYLEKAGIERKRMKPVGYGEQRLAINCACESCLDEEHQANRRTTFKILK